MCDFENEKEFQKLDYDSIKTYPEMNLKIVGLLKIMDNNPVALYAAKLIEELLMNGDAKESLKEIQKYWH